MVRKGPVAKNVVVNKLILETINVGYVVPAQANTIN